MLRVPDPWEKLLGVVLLEVFDRAPHYAKAAFADLRHAYVALAVDEVEGRPSAIPECAPHLEVVIDATGYGTPSRSTALRTFSNCFSWLNSGVWMLSSVKRSSA